MPKIKFQYPYAPHDRVQLVTPEDEKSRTKQSFKDETDINLIMKKAFNGEILDFVGNATARYGDFTQANEFQDAANFVAESNSAFEELPSHIRKEFNNDAGVFFETASNPENNPRMIELGLMAPPAEEPTEPPVAAEAPPAPTEPQTAPAPVEAETAV